jgi:hypothetical protein
MYTQNTFAEMVVGFRARLAQQQERKLSQKAFVAYVNELLGEPVLSEKTLGRIEQDDWVDFSNEKNVIEALATAFELSENEKKEFYALAGLVYHPKSPRPETQLETLVKRYLWDTTYPAQVLTPMWDIVAMNNAISVLYGDTAARIQSMREQPFGSNLLRILFDDRFDQKKYYLDEQRWRLQMLRNIRAFRAVSLKYSQTPRYQKLLKHLHGAEYAPFSLLWQHSFLPDQRYDDEIPVEPSTRILTSCGMVKFWTLRIPQEYIGEQFMVFMYMPADTQSEENYRAFSRTFSWREPFVFDVPEV